MSITNTTRLGVGVFIANDRDNAPNDGVFFDLMETFDIAKLLEKP